MIGFNEKEMKPIDGIRRIWNVGWYLWEKELLNNAIVSAWGGFAFKVQSMPFLT